MFDSFNCGLYKWLPKIKDKKTRIGFYRPDSSFFYFHYILLVLVKTSRDLFKRKSLLIVPMLISQHHLIALFDYSF